MIHCLLSAARYFGTPLAEFPEKEDSVSKRTYGILASVIGGALGAWWWARKRSATSSGTERGEVIFHNTPTSSPLSPEGII